MENADVTAYIGQWRPLSVTPEAAAFARDVITTAEPQARERAKNLLRAAGKLADYEEWLSLLWPRRIGVGVADRPGDLLPAMG